jgi:HTH-type transcriptional regulator / antitoxin HipB
MNMRTPADLGAQIRRARETAGLSQQQLAEKISTTQGRISRIERGDGSVNLRTIITLLAILRLQIDINPAGQDAQTTENDKAGHEADPTANYDLDDDAVDLNAVVNSGLKINGGSKISEGRKPTRGSAK